MQIYQNSQLNFGANPSKIVKDFEQLSKPLNVPYNHVNSAKIALLKEELASLQMEKSDLLQAIKNFGPQYCSVESFYKKVERIEEAIQKIQSQISAMR